MGMYKLASVLIISAVGGVVGGYFGVFLGERGTSNWEHVMRAERFELVGKDGKARAYWGRTSDGHVTTAFLDSKGNVRAEFGVTEDTTIQWLRMCGPDGKTILRLGTNEFSESSLSLGDEQHGSRVLLGSIPSDLPVRTGSWGLVLPRSGTFSSWIEIGIREDPARRRTSPALSIGDASGLRWSAPLGK